MQRSVVVLPQPDGPSRTKQLARLDLEIDVVARDHRAAAEGLPQVIDPQAVAVPALHDRSQWPAPAKVFDRWRWASM